MVLDAHFVTWNVQRRVEGKVSQIEKLIKELHRPPVIALQETADVDVLMSRTAATAAHHEYHLFQQIRSHGRAGAEKSGGVLLLVRKDLVSEPYVWPEAEAWSSDCEAVSVKIHPKTAPPFIVSSVYVVPLIQRHRRTLQSSFHIQWRGGRCR